MGKPATSRSSPGAPQTFDALLRSGDTTSFAEMKWFCVFEDGVLVRAHRGATLVPWWSFTKTILAAAALRLVELGQLSLEEPLQGQSCCLRQLLQHRAGKPIAEVNFPL